MNYRAAMEHLANRLRFIKRNGEWHILDGWHPRKAFCGYFKAGRVGVDHDNTGPLCPGCMNYFLRDPRNGRNKPREIASGTPAKPKGLRPVRRALVPLNGQANLFERDELERADLERRAAERLEGGSQSTTQWLHELGVKGCDDWVKLPTRTIRDAVERLEATQEEPAQ